MLHSPGPAYDLRAAMSQELRAALEELDGASATAAKAVHRCRVRVKRARALARVGRACAPGLSNVFNDSARSVMRLLGLARELPALSEAATELAKRSQRKTATALQAVAASLDEERAAAPALKIESARAALKDLLALAMVWPEASPRQIRRGARRVLRRARRAYQSGAGAREPALRHDWRKREKDRFHAALLLDAAWPAPRRRKLGERLGDLLGKERDALLLLDRLKSAPERAGAGKAAKRAVKALRKRQRRLGEKAEQLAARLHACGA